MAKDNKYIPKFIKDAPWYNSEINDSEDSLAHHRSKDSDLTANNQPRIGSGITDEFIEEGLKNNQLKSNKAAKDLAQIKVNSLSVLKRKDSGDFDQKRDRWYGYDSNDYSEHIKQWADRSEINKNTQDEATLDPDEETELKELGLWELYIINRATFFKDNSKTVRLREDKAVYLQNITNPDSITYDPKSRTDRSDSVGYFNDKNLFVRHLTGDAKKYQQSKVFAWDDTKRGIQNDDNLASNPTLAETRTLKKKENNNQDVLRKGFMDRYTQENDETEDDETARELNKQQPQYEEDVLIGNHTSIWGSYYSNGRWGFKCCRKLEKDSLCE